jgi:hypothetical protein
MLVRNTIAVLGPAVEKRDEWLDRLLQIRNQAKEDGIDEVIALVDAIIKLLNAGGNPAGLGEDLTGIYAQTWQAIIENLPP